MGSRDDQFWAEFLGIDPSEWASPGVSIRAHVGLVGYRGVWCFRRGDRTVVSVPHGWAAPLSAKLERCEPNSLFDETCLMELLGGDFESLIGPAFQGCLEAGRFRPAGSGNVRFIGRDDSAAVDRFRAGCGPEWEKSSGLDEVTHHMAAYFEGERITAMAGYRPWNDYAGDPCVLTHPEFRRRGQGTAVVGDVFAAGLWEGKLLLYQTLEANRGAVQIALNLGFEQYARHMALRLKRESPSNLPLQEIALRECREEDRPFIWQVRRQALKEYVAAIWGWDEKVQQEKFEQRFTPAGHQIVVFDGIDVGLLQVVDEGSHLVVGKIELLPEFQRRGIGSVLMGRILDEARARQVPVRLQVLRTNAPARRLYERLGFVMSGETETHFQMEKSFAASTA
jgi:GNAT superfamily N-acetyltransferase